MVRYCIFSGDGQTILICRGYRDTPFSARCFCHSVFEYSNPTSLLHGLLVSKEARGLMLNIESKALIAGERSERGAVRPDLVVIFLRIELSLAMRPCSIFSGQDQNVSQETSSELEISVAVRF